ncbi:MAG: ABC transporter ATP-binding protein [Thiolinea sp.]
MSAPAIQLNEVVKRFGDFVAVERMHLSIPEGGFVTFLGPSGCGKTTTLRMIAGLLDPSAGDILIKQRRVNDVPIHQRNLGIVFQNYALFPHKTIFDNVAFGLKFRKVPKADIRQRVSEALELVQLPDMGKRYPKQLSGGQQQRVALARAMVIRPDVLLLDEPLSALDAKLREDMRIELKRIQRQTGLTTVFVTHDQSEALAMSDQIVVMSNGRVEQVGPPDTVYNTPASEFVADFLGTSNRLDVTVTALDQEQVSISHPVLGTRQVPRDRAPHIRQEGAARLIVRAEKIRLSAAGTAPDSGIAAAVETVDYQGHLVRYFIRSDDLQLQATSMIDGQLFQAGEHIRFRIDPADCTLLPLEART